MIEPRRGDRRERVGEAHFLHQADRQQEESRGEMERLRLLVRRGGELRHHLAVMQDRPGKQMRKEAHEQRVVEKTGLFRPAAMDVDEICNLREGEEADAERQHDVRQRQRQAGEVGGVAHREVGVLEHAQEQQVGADSAREQGLGVTLRQAQGRL